MNQKVDKFIPGAIAVDHNKYLDNFIEKGNMTIVNQSQRLLFGKNKSLFIFAFIAKVKLETSSNEDLFATALATPHNMNFQYIMLDKFGFI